MAYVDKVLIKGIRSFDPENSAPIDLYKPLTLIVGSNGAGKTTIIESLRVACTGTLPPNARLGQSFVHDPKVAKEREVKAQIMVRFCNTAGDPFVVIRSYQLCQKATSMQFKAIDQTLKKVDPRTNETMVITQTCADMDKIVPTMMGVSRAVLDNVIFVHQDESNWPLSEPKVLKEKFDLLFGTSKYTKWFEEIRKLKTEKTNELKVKKVDLGHLQTHKTKATKLREQIEKREAEMVKMHEAIAELEVEIERVTAESQTVEAALQCIGEKETERSLLSSQLKTMSQINEEMLAKLPDGDYEDDEDSLKEGIGECDETVEHLKREVDRLDDAVRRDQEKAVVHKNEYAKACQQQGMLQAEVSANERNRQERDRYIEQLSEHAGTMVTETENPEAFVAAFEKSVLDAESRLSDMKMKNKELDEKMSEELRSVVMQIETASERMRLHKREKNQNDLKLAQLKKKAVEFLIHETDLEDLESREKEAFEQLAANRELCEAKNFADQIAHAVTEIEAMHLSIQQLKEEKSHLDAASETETKIKWKKQELKTKRGQLTERMAEHRAEIEELLGQEVEACQLKERYRVILEAIQKETAQLEEKLKEAQAARTLAEHRLSTTSADLREKEARLERCRDELSKGLRSAMGREISIDAYTSEFADLEQRFEELKERSSMGEASVKLMKGVIKTAASRSICLVCSREFTEEERDAFIDEKEAEVQNLPERMKNDEVMVETIASQLSQMKALHSVFHEYASLKDTVIPVLKSQQMDLESALTATEMQVATAKTDDERQREKARNASAFAETVLWPVNNLVSDIQASEVLLDELQQRCMQIDGRRSLLDLEAELEALELGKKEQESKKDQLQKEQQDLSSAFVTLSQEHLEIKNEVEKYRTNVANKELHREHASELEQRNASIEAQVTEFEEEIASLQPKKATLDTQRKEERLRSVQTERVMEQQTNEMRHQLDALIRKNRMVRQFDDANTLQRLQDTQQCLKDIDEAQNRLQTSIEDTQKARRELVDDIQRHQDMKRNIQLCLEWRKGKREEDELSAKLDAIQQEIDQIESKQMLVRKLKKLQRETEEFKDTQSRSTGSLGMLQRTLVETREELSSDLYRDIDMQYKSALVDKVLLETGIEDLQTFHQACERALLSYHTMKMEEINAAMKELWRTIYKGSDIEYIEIKAEEVKGHAGRSHNYRLSMSVNGSHLEMRGRCSAGQKVLAGIIVRLALAETFCVKCGILALDEPTTNLDEANVESLADALRDIIENRQQQENFQLIVITHDDNFARKIRTREHAEYLWRVTKDNKNHSTLTRERI